MNKQKVGVSVGIFAHNEEKNIEKIILSFYQQKQESFYIDKIYVFSSGSTDNTNKIVRYLSKKYKNLYLISKPKREGKSYDINEFLSIAEKDIIVISSADIILDKCCLEYLIRPTINDEKVGLTQPRIVPKNSIDTFIGYVVNLQWNISNYINNITENVHTGELVVLRKIIDSIPENVVNDDAYIEFLIRKKGYKCIFVKEAVIFNKGPENINDFIKQRRRIYAGYLELKNRFGYYVEPMNVSLILKVVIKFFPKDNPKKFLWYLGAIGLEAYARLLGMWDYYIKKKNHVVWEIAESTKKLEVK